MISTRLNYKHIKHNLENRRGAHRMARPNAVKSGYGGISSGFLKAQ